MGTGAKQVLYNALMATVDPGDEVIVPAPYWVTYPDMVRLAGGVPVVVSCGETDGFQLRPEALESAITPRTRWLILNSPSNPTGAAYTEGDLKALAAVLAKHPRVWVLSDDIYEHLLYELADGPFATIAAVEPALRERTLTVNGVSKAYCMTGWRIGFAGGPGDLITAMATLQSQSTSCPSAVSQAAAEAALSGPQDFIERNNRVFRERRDLVVSMLNGAPGLTCQAPAGAFYAFPSCTGLLGRKTASGRRLENDIDLVEHLLETAGVAAVPGSAFGLPGYFRVATATTAVREACARIQEACTTVK